MKITKSELKKIIREELETKTPVQEGLENLTPENLEILMKAVQHFATQPAVATALATGGLVAAVAKIKELMQSEAPAHAGQSAEVGGQTVYAKGTKD